MGRATLISSQFPVNQWHKIIVDATVADAILDHLVHNAYRIELKGESMRKDKTPPSEPLEKETVTFRYRSVVNQAPVRRGKVL